MKKQLSTIGFILGFFGLTAVLTCAALQAKPKIHSYPKGSITAGLVQELGIDFPESLLQTMNENSSEKSPKGTGSLPVDSRQNSNAPETRNLVVNSQPNPHLNSQPDSPSKALSANQALQVSQSPKLAPVTVHRAAAIGTSLSNEKSPILPTSAEEQIQKNTSADFANGPTDTAAESTDSANGSADSAAMEIPQELSLDLLTEGTAIQQNDTETAKSNENSLLSNEIPEAFTAETPNSSTENPDAFTAENPDAFTAEIPSEMDASAALMVEPQTENVPAAPISDPAPDSVPDSASSAIPAETPNETNPAVPESAAVTPALNPETETSNSAQASAFPISDASPAPEGFLENSVSANPEPQISPAGQTFELSPAGQTMELSPAGQTVELSPAAGQNAVELLPADGNPAEADSFTETSSPNEEPAQLVEISPAQEAEPLETLSPAEPAGIDQELKPAVPLSGSASTAIQGQGKPGDSSLEGKQTSRLTVEKAAPEEIQVGRPSTWTITVRNEGKTDAAGVQIHDSIPQGTRLVSTHPQANVSQAGEITWNVGTMPSGTMAVVKVELTPLREGEIGSIASVTSRSEASAKTIATRPLLKVETFGDAKVLLGNAVELRIVVSNPGTGIARNVILSEIVPPELQFEGGAELLYQIGDLPPGESRTTQLPLKAVRPGKFTNKITAKSDSGLLMESLLEMEVTAPALDLKLLGPSKRFLDKEGTYRLSLTNSGTAPAKNIELHSTLPNGWKFKQANNFGTFLADRQLIVWKLEELGAGETAEAEFSMIPNEIGTFSLTCEAAADICQSSKVQKDISVEGIAALMFQVVDSSDPIQVGEDTQYSIEVVNQGSKQAENVQVVVDVPAGLQLVSSEENLRAANTSGGKQLVFTPIPTLGPKAAKVYRFTLRGAASGDQRVAVKLSSKEFPTPIVKEESTRVFSE